MSKQQIRHIIEQHSQRDGLTETGIKGVQLFQATSAIPCVPAVYEPCVIAIVSGAAAGIGRATAHRLAEEGAKICLGDIDRTGAESCAADIRARGGEALPLALDVAEEADWRRIINATVEHFGGLDILVNNAGIAFAAGLEETTTEQWRRIMAVNVDSVFFGCKFALPAMRESGGGAIVNISSILGLVGSPVQAAYSATKGAVNQLTQSIALQYARKKIRANASRRFASLYKWSLTHVKLWKARDLMSIL